MQSLITEAREGGPAKGIEKVPLTVVFKVNIHQHHLEGLLKHYWGSTPGISDSVGVKPQTAFLSAQ